MRLKEEEEEEGGKKRVGRRVLLLRLRLRSSLGSFHAEGNSFLLRSSDVKQNSTTATTMTTIS
jgi:hypothetical protein